MCVSGSNAVVPPGLPSALRGYIVGNSNFELNLQPPQETAQDVKEALDSLTKFESEKLAIQCKPTLNNH